jgi:hypothetical protein
MTARAPARASRVSGLRIAACLILGAIGFDVFADSRCDVQAISTSPIEIRAESQRQGGTGEPCVPFCIPDCFCCSRSVAAGPVVVPPEPRPLMAVDTLAAERRSEGVLPVVDHPPLLRG